MIELKTPRLLLRPLTPADEETVHEYAGDRENTQYMMYLPNETRKETAAFLQRVAAEWQKDEPGFYEFAIVLNGAHIGAVSVALDKSRQKGTLGWIVCRKQQGKGCATEAAKAVADFALRTLGVRKLVAYCDARNAASCRVMQKIGLTLEREDGTRRYRGSDEDVAELKYAMTVL